MIKRFNILEESEPQMCISCRYGIVHVGYEDAADDGQRVSCMKHHKDERRQPKAMKPLPPNTDARTWTPTFNADEHRDCFEPTPVGSPKMTWLERLGLL